MFSQLSVVSQLQSWSQLPQTQFQPSSNVFGVFGEPLSTSEDEVLSALSAFVSGEVEIQLDALQGVLEA